MNAVPADQALDRYFLEARSKLLDVAAILDRISRGSDPSAVAGDARVARIRRALVVLQEPDAGRAERIQQIFSLEYDPTWRRP
jgi:hypothetical protein